MLLLKGIMALILTLCLFSLFSMKCPGGNKAMNGLAGAALATFLVEAIYKYIGGDFMGFEFLGEVGVASGTMGGVAAAILVGISMGMNPIFAVAMGAAVAGFGILPGFIAAYLLFFVLRFLENKLPAGIDIILCTLIAAAGARLIAMVSAPAVEGLIGIIGNAIMVATDQSPIMMGFLLGGMIKVVCTSPLSSMALTAMLGLTGLPMGIAAIASFGGAFTDGMTFKRLKLAGPGSSLAVMLEPLTQAEAVSRNPIPIYSSNFMGGGLSGIVAVLFGIINNAPGTAAPIPGMLAPFAFNDPLDVIMALGAAAICGICAGLVGTQFYLKTQAGKTIRNKTCKPAAEQPSA